MAKKRGTDDVYLWSIPKYGRAFMSDKELKEFWRKEAKPYYTNGTAQPEPTRLFEKHEINEIARVYPDAQIVACDNLAVVIAKDLGEVAGVIFRPWRLFKKS
jgi:hypothetical protein